MERPDVSHVDDSLKYPPGTCLVRGSGTYRYCQAGEKLKPGQIVYLAPQETPTPDKHGLYQITKEMKEALFQDMRASGPKGKEAGISLVEVDIHKHFWLLTHNL